MHINVLSILEMSTMKWNPEDYARNSDAQLQWAQELRQNLNLQAMNRSWMSAVEMENC